MVGEPSILWVYAVTPVGSAPPPGTGVDGGALRRVAHRGLAAVASPVDWAGRLGELERRLQDPQRLEQVARAHHEVVDACFRGGPTVPFRLGTLYRGEDGVRGLLAQRREELAAALTMVTGRAEWGVQAYAATAAHQPEAGEEPAEAAGANPGTAYLLRRRGQREARERAERAAWEAAGRIDAALAAMAVAARCQSSVGSAAAGTRRAPRCSTRPTWSMRRRAEFRSVVERLARRYAEVALRLTGPWPATPSWRSKEAGDG